MPNRANGRFSLVASLLLLTAWVAGCSDTTDPGEETGTLRVSVLATGHPVDLGFTVSTEPIGRTDPVTLEDTLVMDGLAPGRYTVTYTVPENCAVPDGATQTRMVDAGAETHVRFRASCGRGRWVSLTSPSPSNRRLQMAFRDTANGFLLARSDGGAGQGGPLDFFVTADGGATWSQRSNQMVDGDMGAFLYFRDDGVAFTGGSDQRLLRSQDGGVSWSTHQLGTTFHYILTAFFLDPMHGWAAGGGGRIFRTRDGGVHWEQLTPPQNQPIFGVFFSDTVTGVVVTAIQGPFNRAYHTEDGGLTWSARETGAPSHLQGLSFANDSIGVAVGDGGAIVRTTDGGLNWTPIPRLVTTVLWAVDMRPDGFGVAVGEDGVVLATDDFGATWEMELGAPQADCCARVSVADAEHAWVAGQGVVLRRERIE